MHLTAAQELEILANSRAVAEDSAKIRQRTLETVELMLGTAKAGTSEHRRLKMHRRNIAAAVAAAIDDAAVDVVPKAD